MGGISGVVLADGGGLDVHPGQVQLLHPGDKVDVHIGGKDVLGGDIDLLGAQVQLIEHSGHRPGVLGGHAADVQVGDGLAVFLGFFAVQRPFALDAEALAHLAQQPLGVGQGLGGLRRLGELLRLFAEAKKGFGPIQKTGLLGRRTLLRLLRGLCGVLNPLHFHTQPAQPGKGLYHIALVVLFGDKIGLAGGKGEGGSLGNGQAVGPLHPLRPGGLNQGHEDRVPLALVLPHQLGIQPHLVNHFVRHQHLAVSVIEIPPGGGDGLLLSDLLLGLPAVAFAVVDLQVIQGGAHSCNHQSQQQHNGPRPAMKLFGVHWASFML